jgi:hypothetical protein
MPLIDNPVKVTEVSKVISTCPDDPLKIIRRSPTINNKFNLTIIPKTSWLCDSYKTADCSGGTVT